MSERELAAEAHSYAGGTEAWYLARAVRARSFDVHFHIPPGLDPEISFPAVAGVRLDETGHFIAILSRDGDLFQVGDPLVGSEKLTRKDLLDRYAFTGFYMTIGNGNRRAQ